MDQLIEKIANDNAVRIEWRLISGGASCPRTSRQIKAAQPDTGQEHFVVVFHSFSAVKARVGGA